MKRFLFAITLAAVVFTCAHAQTMYRPSQSEINTLPAWAQAGTRMAWPGPWGEACVLQVAPQLRLVFVELHTEHHLTNHKPAFMLQLLDSA